MTKAGEATYTITVKPQCMNAGIKHTQIIHYEMLTLLSYVILYNTYQSSHKTFNTFTSLYRATMRLTGENIDIKKRLVYNMCTNSQ